MSSMMKPFTRGCVRAAQGRRRRDASGVLQAGPRRTMRPRDLGHARASRDGPRGCGTGLSGPATALSSSGSSLHACGTGSRQRVRRLGSSSPGSSARSGCDRRPVGTGKASAWSRAPVLAAAVGARRATPPRGAGGPPRSRIVGSCPGDRAIGSRSHRPGLCAIQRAQPASLREGRMPKVKELARHDVGPRGVVPQEVDEPVGGASSRSRVTVGEKERAVTPRCGRQVAHEGSVG